MRRAECRTGLRFQSRSKRRESEDQRSEEHTSELQSQSNLVCRLLLEKKRRIHRIDLLSILRHPGNRDFARLTFIRQQVFNVSACELTTKVFFSNFPPPPTTGFSSPPA